MGWLKPDAPEWELAAKAIKIMSRAITNMVRGFVINGSEFYIWSIHSTKTIYEIKLRVKISDTDLSDIFFMQFLDQKFSRRSRLFDILESMIMKGMIEVESIEEFKLLKVSKLTLEMLKESDAND